MYHTSIVTSLLGICQKKYPSVRVSAMLLVQCHSPCLYPLPIPLSFQLIRIEEQDDQRSFGQDEDFAHSV